MEPAMSADLSDEDSVDEEDVELLKNFTGRQLMVEAEGCFGEL